MKTLVLMRHGKAVDTANSGKDFDRALSAKGQEQIKVMLAWLKEQSIVPDCVVSSSALRTQETARGIARGTRGQGRRWGLDNGTVVPSRDQRHARRSAVHDDFRPRNLGARKCESHGTTGRPGLPVGEQ